MESCRPSLSQISPPQCATAHAKLDELQVVVATCREPLEWTALLRPARVLVVEHCGINGTKRSDGVASAGWQKKHPLAADGGSIPAQYERVALAPNRGREAHAYLWYIFTHWDSLAPMTLFLQGDVLRHGVLGATGLKSIRQLQCPGGALRQLAAECWDFFSLAGHHPGTFGGEPFRTKCEFYRDFRQRGPHEVETSISMDSAANVQPVGSATPCKLWEVTTSGGNFAVHRDAIRRQPRAAYERWLRILESRKESDDAFYAHVGLQGRWWQDKLPRGVRLSDGWSAKAGASFMERSWAFVFGCSRPTGKECAFDLGTNATELKRRCPPDRSHGNHGWVGCRKGQRMNIEHGLP